MIEFYGQRCLRSRPGLAPHIAAGLWHSRILSKTPLQPSYPEIELRSFVTLATSAVVLATYTILDTADGDQRQRKVRLKTIADAYTRDVVLAKSR